MDNQDRIHLVYKRRLTKGKEGPRSGLLGGRRIKREAGKWRRGEDRWERKVKLSRRKFDARARTDCKRRVELCEDEEGWVDNESRAWLDVQVVSNKFESPPVGPRPSMNIV